MGAIPKLTLLALFIIHLILKPLLYEFIIVFPWQLEMVVRTCQSIQVTCLWQCNVNHAVYKVSNNPDLKCCTDALQNTTSPFFPKFIRIIVQFTAWVYNSKRDTKTSERRCGWFTYSSPITHFFYSHVNKVTEDSMSNDSCETHMHCLL